MSGTTVDLAKRRLREEVCSRLERRGAAVFPGARGRIPGFKGAWDAARRLATRRTELAL